MDCQAPSLRLIHHLKGRGSVKKRTPLYLAILGAFVLIFVEIARYSYINRGLMRQENVSHLQASYAQVARTFALFAERNWKLLDEWDTDMPNQLYDLTSEEAWSIIRDKAARWQYNDLYMFNQNGEYSSLSGRHGISEHKNSAFMEVYRENQPVLTSYRSPDGARKVVFAKPIHTPVLMEGTTYTGLAVTYRNDALEQTISVSLYDGASDCYMVKSDGTVVLSLESQTEFDGLHDNMLDFVDGALAVSRSEKAEMRADIAEGQSGSLVGRLNGEEYYIVYQPAGMADWSIVGVVRASVVEAGARKMQADTISLATLIASLTMLGVSWLILGNMKAEAEYRQMEQQTLARQKALSDRLFTGMGRIVDRYTVCDLVRDRYEYHENVLSKLLYPETGRYRDLVELMNRRYLVLGRAEGMKIDQTLDPDYLRRVLRKETDILKFEYCIREKNVYALLNIIPIAFDGDGLPTQVMMIGQDIGQKVELENLANTDGLTGLFNERYFSHVLADQEKKKLPFALYYLDLDFFKPINDTYGHDMGDKLLKAVAKRLQTCIRSHDFAFRIGGDEFAVVYRADLTEAQRREKQALIVDTLTRPYEIDGKRLQIGASCGYAHYPEDSAAAADIQKIAAIALQLWAGGEEALKRLVRDGHELRRGKAARCVQLDKAAHEAAGHRLILGNAHILIRAAHGVIREVARKDLDLLLHLRIGKQHLCGFAQMARERSDLGNIAPRLFEVGFPKLIGCVNIFDRPFVLLCKLSTFRDLFGFCHSDS